MILKFIGNYCSYQPPEGPIFRPFFTHRIPALNSSFRALDPQHAGTRLADPTLILISYHLSLLLESPFHKDALQRKQLSFPPNMVNANLRRDGGGIRQIEHKTPYRNKIFGGHHKSKKDSRLPRAWI